MCLCQSPVSQLRKLLLGELCVESRIPSIAACIRNVDRVSGLTSTAHMTPRRTKAATAAAAARRLKRKRRRRVRPRNGAGLGLSRYALSYGLSYCERSLVPSNWGGGGGFLKVQAVHGLGLLPGC